MASACVANIVAALFVLTKLKFWSYIDIKNYKSSTTKKMLACMSQIHHLDIKISFTTHFFGKIQYIGIK